MKKTIISEDMILKTAAMIANQEGLEKLSLKLIAETLNIKSPSLYNHVSSLEDIKEKIMIYGWKEMETLMIESAVGVSGYDALKAMSYAFFDYATTHQGVFSDMLWYNKYENEQAQKTTTKLFDIIFRIMKPLHISEDNINHIIRTLRSFLQGYAMLVNNHAFGNPLDIKESFDLSLDIIMKGIKTLEGD